MRAGTFLVRREVLDDSTVTRRVKRPGRVVECALLVLACSPAAVTAAGLDRTDERVAHRYRHPHSISIAISTVTPKWVTGGPS